MNRCSYEEMKEYCSEDGGYNGPSAQIINSKRTGHMNSNFKKNNIKKHDLEEKLQDGLDLHYGKSFLSFLHHEAGDFKNTPARNDPLPEPENISEYMSPTNPIRGKDTQEEGNQIVNNFSLTSQSSDISTEEESNDTIADKNQNVIDLLLMVVKGIYKESHQPRQQRHFSGENRKKTGEERQEFNKANSRNSATLEKIINRPHKYQENVKNVERYSIKNSLNFDNRSERNTGIATKEGKS